MYFLTILSKYQWAVARPRIQTSVLMVYGRKIEILGWNYSIWLTNVENPGLE